jgi:hypothetical protein
MVYSIYVPSLPCIYAIAQQRGTDGELEHRVMHDFHDTHEKLHDSHEKAAIAGGKRY